MIYLKSRIIMRSELKFFRKLVMAAICLVVPRGVSGRILSTLRYNVSPEAKIGLSLIWVDNLSMERKTVIGNFNFIRTRRVVMREASIIRQFNVLRGPFSVCLGRGAVIGRRNEVGRAPRGITVGPALLRLGKGAIITANHKIDCTASVEFGDHCVLAGAGSQLWTHGYVHEDEVPKRYRVDGAISIGCNVYIGSRVNILGGVRISDNINIGVGVTVSKSLDEPGMYVAAGLRLLPKPGDPGSRGDMARVTAPDLIETVYRKR